MGCLVHLGAVWALSGRLGAVLGCLGLLGAVLGSRRILEASWAISGPSISVFCGQLSGDKLGLSIFFGGALALRRLSKAASGGSTRFLTSAWRDPKRHSKLDSIFRAFGQISMPFCASSGRRTMAEARKRERCGKGIGGGNANKQSDQKKFWGV